MAGIVAVLILFFAVVHFIRHVLNFDGDIDDISASRTRSNTMTTFADMGQLRGKTLQEITANAGVPNSYSVLAPRKILAQWIQPGMHVALMFEYRGPENSDWGLLDQHRADYVCLGVTHQCVQH
jgi:hypothetical protein